MNLKGVGKGFSKWGVASVIGVVGIVGATAAIFLDPDSGPGRRKTVRKKSTAAVKRERAHVAAMVGVAKTHVPSRKPKSTADASAEEAVGHALASLGVYGVDVSIRDGVARLHGEVADLRDIRACEDVARSVHGVIAVDNVLRLSA